MLLSSRSVWQIIFNSKRFTDICRTNASCDIHTLTYTEYFAEAMVFNDIVAVHRNIERHGPLKLATVIKT